MYRIKKSKKQEQSNKIDEKLSQEFIDITNLMYEKLDGGHKKTTVIELFGDLELRNQFYRMKEIASFSLKKRCVFGVREILKLINSTQLISCHILNRQSVHNAKKKITGSKKMNQEKISLRKL